MVITSPNNEKIKELGRLISNSRERRKKGLYIVEGIRMFREIENAALEAVIVSEGAYEGYRRELDVYETKLLVISDKIYMELSDTDTPQGIMAVVKIKEWTVDDILKRGESPFLFIIEKLQDPGNLGTIIRTSEGAGVTGIMLSSDSVDLYNPKVVRATMGAIFRVPVYVSKNLIQDIEKVKKSGVKIYGAHLKGDIFYNNSYNEGCAFLIGNEGNGLSEEVSQKADALIKIPMRGRLESLNAAASAAIIGYEVLRQRGGYTEN